MTPACRLLSRNKISYSIHEYEHDPQCSNFGLEAAQKLNLPLEQVFKTLLVTDDQQFYVAILPVSHSLNLKKAALAFKVKKLHMADIRDAERITGYLVGGISPIGQKKRLKTIIDSRATQWQCMYVSGGKRGLDIGLTPQALAQVVQATFADIVDNT
ncbi:Cys-tRNA(Pro) deacylase [Alkanindiges sp. WGS2144]|uniref:Cys-tRNA(Pro) deacylase n=1 Tax=Alkanindiges sp. WGS2144 TaxID=3366808 RepID=UPI003750A4B7